MVEDYGLSLKFSKEKSASPIGEDLEEDAARVGYGGRDRRLCSIRRRCGRNPSAYQCRRGSGAIRLCRGG